MTLESSFYLELPPTFAGQPFLYMVATGSLLLVVLLCMEWLWRTAWSIVERPSGRRDPATSQRIMTALILAAILIRISPDLGLYAFWHEMSPESRQFLSLADKRVEPISAFLFSLAWLLSYLAEPMVVYQLQREPLPIHLFPTWKQAQRPLKIGVGAFAIAFALAYLR